MTSRKTVSALPAESHQPRAHSQQRASRTGEPAGVLDQVSPVHTLRADGQRICQVAEDRKDEQPRGQSIAPRLDVFAYPGRQHRPPRPDMKGAAILTNLRDPGPQLEERRSFVTSIQTAKTTQDVRRVQHSSNRGSESPTCGRASPPQAEAAQARRRLALYPLPSSARQPKQPRRSQL